MSDVQSPTGLKVYHDNFVVFYECDKTEAHHTLCFDSYNDDEVATSPIGTWILLDRTADDTSGM